MGTLTDRQFAQELRGLFDEADKYEGMKSSVQWQIADRLARRYPKGMPIPEAVAFVTDRDLQTLRAYRATATAWPQDARNPAVSFAAHRSLNPRVDRFDVIRQVRTADEAREAAELAPTTSAPRPQSADSDIDDAFGRMADLLDAEPARREPADVDEDHLVDHVASDPSLTARVIERASEKRPAPPKRVREPSQLDAIPALSFASGIRYEVDKADDDVETVAALLRSDDARRDDQVIRALQEIRRDLAYSRDRLGVYDERLRIAIEEGGLSDEALQALLEG